MSIVPFTFPETGTAVRTITIDGDPWFVGKDACDVVGISKYRDALAQLDEDERASATVDTPGGPQRMVLVSEPGIYALMLISRSPKVHTFRRWITHEVIPSIRRTGGYSVAPREMSKLEALTAAIESEKGRLAAEARVAELEPAAESWNTLASADGDFSVADAAKILARAGIKTGRDRLFGILHEIDWAFVQRADHRYRANQYAIERRWLTELPQTYTHPQTGVTTLAAPQVRVTVKGLRELHKRLGGTGTVQTSLLAIGGAR